MTLSFALGTFLDKFQILSFMRLLWLQFAIDITPMHQNKGLICLIQKVQIRDRIKSMWEEWA